MFSSVPSSLLLRTTGFVLHPGVPARGCTEREPAQRKEKRAITRIRQVPEEEDPIPWQFENWR
jgi:hypothetical protein